jgi:hypothetical protein
MTQPTIQEAYAALPQCEGCGERTLLGRVCFECCQARARVACGGNRCKCPKSKRRETGPLGAVGQKYGRIFTSCERCLGTVSQIR